MKLAENIIGRLQDLGATLPPEALEEVERMTHHDYIPRGGSADWKDMINWRLAPPGYRCCLQTGNDIQSGPYFCGDPAVVMADIKDHENAVIFLCKKHARGWGIPWETRQEIDKLFVVEPNEG